ncbi:MAG: hypothetical protein RLZZ08_407 [Pseudomonadota bacterium]|jgi:uncharacterized metal-binding protein YceD (DUF177 family)
MTEEAELSRVIDRRQILAKPVEIVATPAECAALADRFGIVRIERLDAVVHLTVNGPDVEAKGRLHADIVQSCAISGDDLSVQIDTPLAVRFVPDQVIEVEELELTGDELDDIPYTGTTFDLGEAVAQTLALSIDPYATGPDADRVRREKGLLDEASSGPFAALAALKKD